MQGFFRGFWEKGPCPNWEFFKEVYTVFTYINSWNVVFTDHLSQVNKRFLEFHKSLDYMVSGLFVSMLKAKGISVEMGFFS
jgi:hypothetical protein